MGPLPRPAERRGIKCNSLMQMRQAVYILGAKRPLRTQIPQRFVERDTGIEPAEKNRKTIENTTFFAWS